MQHKRKKVLVIDSEISFLEEQKKELSIRNLDDHLYSFDNIDDAFNFIETHVIGGNKKLHYIILDEKVVGKQLSNSMDRFWELNSFLRKPDIIVLTEEKNNTLIRNQIMQYSFVSVFLVKPIPSDYIQFLITGQIA